MRWTLYPGRHVVPGDGIGSYVPPRFEPRLPEGSEAVVVVPAAQLATAVEAVEIADALAIAVLNGSANAKIIAEGYRAARIAAATEGQ